MKKEDIIDEVNRRYCLKKREQYPYRAPEQLPEGVSSEQIKTVIEVFAEIIEKLTEKKETVYHIDEEEFKERNGFM